VLRNEVAEKKEKGASSPSARERWGFFRWFISVIFEVVSGEFILRYMQNGGKAILMRAIFVSLLIFSIAILLKSYASGGVVFTFSPQHFRGDANAHFSWFGAIFGGVYVALYTRFTAQWSYLSALYNQQMCALVTTSIEKANSDRASWVKWKAAFVEDAIDMHLYTKRGISNVVHEYLQDPEVKSILEDNKFFGNKRIKEIDDKVNKVLLMARG